MISSVNITPGYEVSGDAAMPAFHPKRTLVVFRNRLRTAAVSLVENWCPTGKVLCHCIAMGITDRKAEALEISQSLSPRVTFAAISDVTLGPAIDLFPGAR